MRRLVLLVAAAFAFLLAGCEVGGPAVATPSSAPPSLEPFTITRTGGFVDHDDTLEVDADGQWTYTSLTGPTSTGRFDSAARTRLAGILADADLATQIAAMPSLGCCDLFSYELHISEDVYMFEDSGQLGSLVARLLDLLGEQTPF
ncbi:MAG TPA: hypothetical protein VH561_12765 [Micromonosporaceae bacterium]|jgi:hypothetical protein